MEWGNSFISDLISYPGPGPEKVVNYFSLGGGLGIMVGWWLEGRLNCLLCRGADWKQTLPELFTSLNAVWLCSNPKESSSSPNGWPGVSFRPIRTLLEALISRRGNQLLHITDYCTLWSAYLICLVFFPSPLCEEILSISLSKSQLLWMDVFRGVHVGK